MTARRWRVEPLPESGRSMVVADDGQDLAIITDPANAEAVTAEHNALVDALEQRPTIGSLEAFATRVLAAAIREVIRGALPHPLRWAAKRVSPSGDKPVYDTEESDARAR